MSDIHKDSIYTVFAKMYTSRVNLYKKVHKLEQELDLKMRDQFLLKTCILQKEEEINKKKSKPITKDFVFTLSKGLDTYFEVLDIGKLVDTSYEKYHTKEYIYPVGYKSRRIFVSYKDPENTKMAYICEIKETGMCIITEGCTWTDPDLWKKFCDSFEHNLEFKSVEHFLGLTYKPVQYRIEKLGDMSLFVNYVMVDDRKKLSQ